MANSKPFVVSNVFHETAFSPEEDSGAEAAGPATNVYQGTVVGPSWGFDKAGIPTCAGYDTQDPAVSRRESSVKLTDTYPIAYPQAVKPTFYATWSPPPSPDLSSFPSQSWTIVIDGNTKMAKSPKTACGNENTSSMSDATISGISRTPSDSYGPFRSTSPTSSSATVIGTSASPAKLGLDGIAKVSSPTKGPSAKVSHTTCAATIIFSRNAIAASISTLTGFWEIGNRTRTTAKYAGETAFFLPPFCFFRGFLALASFNRSTSTAADSYMSSQTKSAQDPVDIC
ncbi:hypothetical protein L210DRAFT_3648268 [Boletus edulis BED1]|uniref:Uncharacterized protein n=1 Tax=Boletus edulis BED1 TaxID=1328754 RepID=A0AAD4GBX9_BOLED|nr:hypothetical protein L210DRAFT_3648268 [Boletus edulis BED1]